MEQKSNTFTQIYDIVRQIPYGKVATYGQIAELAGNKRLSRVVGYASAMRCMSIRIRMEFHATGS